MSMETDSPVVYHGTSESRFPKETNQKKQIETLVSELSAKEREILRQCNRESLYYRCIPFMITGIAATQLAVRKGWFTPHPVWGTSLSMTGAAFVGWILGKFAYRSKCEDKFLNLENSPLADAIRRKRGYVLERYPSDFSKSKTSEDEMEFDDPAFRNYSDKDYHSSSGSLNLDVDKNVHYSGLDDLGRPSTDRDIVQISEENEQVRKFTSYDELRRRNREEYERSESPLSSKLNIGPPADSKPYSNIDSNPPRRDILI